MIARPSRGQLARGFSLLEVLVATAVLCVLVLLLNQIISSTMDVVGQGRRFFEIHSKARAALDLLGRDLSQGLYREDIEKSFQDDSSNSALVFFTRRGAALPVSANSLDFRQLSLVVYKARDEESTGFSLWRGAVNVQWDGVGTYPAVASLNSPMPFDKTSISEGYKAATGAGGTFEPILKGVARLELRFLANDGKYYSTYEGLPNGAVAKAAVVTLLVIDEKTEVVVRSNPALLTAFRQNFLGNSYLETPASSEETLGSLWDAKLAQPEIWGGIPQRFRNGVTTVERIISLR